MNSHAILKTNAPVQEDEFTLVLALCRSAAATRDEVLSWQVERLQMHYERTGQEEKSQAIKKVMEPSAQPYSRLSRS